MSSCFKRLAVVEGTGFSRSLFRAEKEPFCWAFTFSSQIAIAGAELVISDGEDGETYPLKDMVEGKSKLDFSRGAAVAVVVGGKVVAYGRSGITLGSKAFAEKFIDVYDDEAIAENNYYAQVEKSAGDYGNENEDADFAVGGGKGKEEPSGFKRSRQDDFSYRAYEEQETRRSFTRSDEDTQGFDHAQIGYSERHGSGISRLLDSGAPYKKLCAAIPNGAFSEIKTGDKSYFFGVVGRYPYEYLCYAVSAKRESGINGGEKASDIGERAEEKPFGGDEISNTMKNDFELIKERGEVFYIPEPPFCDGEGYYAVFCDAFSGERVKSVPFLSGKT